MIAIVITAMICMTILVIGSKGFNFYTHHTFEDQTEHPEETPTPMPDIKAKEQEGIDTIADQVMKTINLYLEDEQEESGRRQN